jgi:hypothetical protein
MPQSNSVSANRDKIHAFLINYAGGKYADSGVERDFDSGNFVLLLPPSECNATDRAVAMLENRLLRDLKLTVAVKRLAGAANDALSSTLLKALAKQFGTKLADVVLSVDGDECDVVIVVQDVEDLPDDAVRKRILRRVTTILETLGFDTQSVLYAVLRGDAPSEYQLLRHISVLAPVQSGALLVSLREDSLHVPSVRWLDRQLDRLTRQNLVKFQKEIGFVLTEDGLSYLPRLEHRNSPDIQRALALAKRNWIK